MALVRLVCWNPELALERSRGLKASGFLVDASPLQTGRLIGQFRENPPAVVLIDLDRLPSHGREVAVALRGSKSTCMIPIVIAGGVPDKVDRIREEVPDAFFVKWHNVAPVLKRALQRTVSHPVRPIAHMDRFAGTPLVKKLGVLPKMKVSLLAAPEEFAEGLGGLPESVELAPTIDGHTQLVIWFVRSRSELEVEMEYLTATLPQGCSVWIVHPKKTGQYRVDFNQNDVRTVGLRAGLVDYKVCAVDADWSGLKFARKKE